MQANFIIKSNGSQRISNDKHATNFYAETPEGKLLATITARYMLSGKWSDRFLNVCFMDGSVEIADREEGEHETEHASEIIAKKLFSK